MATRTGGAPTIYCSSCEKAIKRQTQAFESSLQMFCDHRCTDAYAKFVTARIVRDTVRDFLEYSDDHTPADAVKFKIEQQRDRLREFSRQLKKQSDGVFAIERRKNPFSADDHRRGF